MWALRLVGSSLRKMIAFLELRALGGVTFTVSNAEVLSNEGAVAIREIASIYLLGSI